MAARAGAAVPEDEPPAGGGAAEKARCCAGKTPAQKYAPILAGLDTPRAARNAARCLYLHSRRAFASEQLVEPIASASECDFLTRENARLKGRTALNVSAWRRSCLVILAVSSAITLGFRTRDLADELARAEDISATASSSSRRLLNGTDPGEAAVSFMPTDFYLERPKIVGGPGCNECGAAAAAATGCSRAIHGQCSWATVEAAKEHCGSWSQCGGFVCQNARTDCQARGKGRESDLALSREGFSLSRLSERDYLQVIDGEDSGVAISSDFDAWRSTNIEASLVCPDRSTDPTCDLGAATYLKTPDYTLEGFGSYSKRFAKVIVARLAERPMWTSVKLQAAVLLLSLCGFVSLVGALFSWHSYAPASGCCGGWLAGSRRRVLLAWFFIFMGPAVVSVVPLRLFVDWNLADGALADYLEMFKQHFNIDAAEAAITAACDAAAGDGTASSDGRGVLTTAIDEVCGTVDDTVPRGLRIHHEFSANVGCWIFSGTVHKTLVDRTYDFAPIHEACDEARELEAAEDDQNALAKVQVACASFMDVTTAQPGGNAGMLLNTAQAYADKALTSAELLLGVTHAVRTFKLLLPAALSIGPGLLRGSIKVKTFVPQSSIPGMFICLLPWLYTPLVWCLYNIAFQLVGNLYMCIGLIFLAFGPLLYWAFGEKMQITLPMTDNQILKWLFWVSLQGKIVSVLAYASMLYWLSLEDSSKKILDAVESFQIADVSGTAILGIVSNTVTSFLLTTLASTDYFIGEIYEQRELEQVLNGFGGAKTKLRIMRTLVAPSTCTGCGCCCKKAAVDQDTQEVATLQDVLDQRNEVLEELRVALRPPGSADKSARAAPPNLRASQKRDAPSGCVKNYKQLPVKIADDPAPGNSAGRAPRCCRVLWFYLKHLPVHFSRAMESAKLLDDVVSEAEAAHLAENLGLEKGRTANLISWRRSALMVACFLSSIAAIFLVTSLVTDAVDLSDLRALSLTTSRRLVNEKVQSDIQWTYESLVGLPTATVIIGVPECEIAPGMAGQCSWPVSAAEESCSSWAKCGGFACAEGAEFCQARGHAAGEPRVVPADDGATVESHLKLGASVEEPLADYSTRVLKVGLARLRLGSAEASWWAQAVVVGCVLTSLALSVRALAQWDDYYHSMRSARLAWLLTMMGPCLVSLLPLRLFINADGFASAMDDFVEEISLEYSIQQQLVQSLQLCQAIVLGEYDEEYAASKARLEGAISGACTAVDTFLPRTIEIHMDYSINIPCVADVDIDIDESHDFRSVHDGCTRARAAIASDSAAGALDETKNACLDFIELTGGESGNAVELMQMVDEYQEQAVQAGEIVFSFVQALTSFRILVPAAIAVAPAVIRGALKVKTLVPQSSIPGMFIMLLPWVYCPLVWCFSSMLFQLVGSIAVLLGLVLLAYSPMVYFVVGRWYRITMPMSNAVVLSVLKWIEGYHTILATAAYVSLIVGLVKTDWGIFEKFDINIIGHWPALVSIVFSASSGFMLTTLAGFDFMVNTIVQQRRSENVQGSVYRSGGGVAGLCDRDERLDDLCSLFPSPFDEAVARPARP